MNRWESDFEAHALWPSVEKLHDLLDQCRAADDAAEQDHINRLRRLLAELQARRQSDAMLTPGTTLDSLHSGVVNVLNNVQHYLNQPAAWSTYLVPAATTHTDQVLAYVAQMPPPPRSAAAKAAVAAAKAYREAAEDLIANVRTTAERAIAAVEQERAENADATSQALADLKSLGSSIAQAESRVNEQVTRLDTALTTHQSAFETQQSERADRFQTDLEALRERAEEQRKQFEQDSREYAKEESEATAARLAELQDLHEQAKGLVEATGRRAVTTEFGEYAAAQGRAAFRWSIAAVGLALGGFMVMAGQILTLSATSLSWELTAYKIAASAALFVVAGYAGKQSAEHREQERQAKRRQLEINALEPFLSRLPEEQQQDLRAKMADRILVQPASDTAGPLPSESASLGDVGGMIGSALRTFSGKG